MVQILLYQVIRAQAVKNQAQAEPGENMSDAGEISLCRPEHN
jgi:hypothetical protein